jgi:hypothetical protein
VKCRSTFETARDELLKLQQLRTLMLIDGRRPSVVHGCGDTIVGFGLVAN